MTTSVKFIGVTKYYSKASPFTFTRRRANEKILGVEDVSLDIPSGEIFGLVGRNGQGKTTLVKCLAGLIDPTEGHVELFGGDCASSRKKIGLVSSDERSFYWRLTGWQNLFFFSRLHGMTDQQARQAITPLLAKFELQSLAERRFDSYSAGNKQRLAIIRALLNDPILLILDEPTRSLDPIAADSLRRLILDWKKESPQRTAIITSHNFAEIESLCDRIGILSRNRLAECAPLEILRSRYPAHDQVTILVQPYAGRQEWMWLKNKIPTLQWKRMEDDQWQLTFLSCGAEINEAFSGLVHGKDIIISCHTERIGLREILERVDGKTR